MKYTTALAAVLFGATTLAAPAKLDDESTVYNINGFTTRKFDGQNVAIVFFNITATNGGSLDFECAPYDPVTDAAAQAFESRKVYFCGKNSLFSFSYDLATTELFLWQDIAEGNTIGGNIATGEPICRAGGSNVNDLVCSVVDPLSISMTRL